MATPKLSMSAKLFQERRDPEGRLTHRLPTPRSDLDRNLVHRIPLEPPYPTVDALQEHGGHPPDAGETSPWPWQGREEIA